jgi:polyhydroxyalkanoate synthesis regulator phasin
MPAARSSSGSSRASGPSKSAAKPSSKRTPAKSRSVAGKAKSTRKADTRSTSGVGDGPASLVEQLVGRVIKPLGLVVLTRERIQETLDEAAERGRVTRADANELVAELVARGRQQTDDLVKDVERVLGLGRGQIETATKQSMDRIVRSADRARRTMGVGPSFPILGYDDLTAGQVDQRLSGLKPAELRQVRDHERRHANRKSVLDAIEKALA